MSPNDQDFRILRCRAVRTAGRFLVFILVCIYGTIGVAGNLAEQNMASRNDVPEFNAGDVIIGHMLDTYGWHLFDIGKHNISIPLPVILFYNGRMYTFFSSKFHHGHSAHKGFRISTDGPSKGRVIRVLEDGITPDPHASFILDLSITKNVFAIFIASALICFIFISAAKSYRSVSGANLPSRMGSLLEPVIIFIRDQIAIGAIGHKHHERYLPYLLTLFFFIFFNNLLGLIPFFPGGANITGNISVTLVLALFTFFTTQLFANKGYWRHIFNTPGVPFWLKLPIPLMPVIELVGVIIKPFVLMIRLFANIMAGHMILLGFVSLIFILGNVNHFLGYGIAPLSVLFLIFMNFLELLVAFIQAYVFTLFSALFFGLAVPEEHH
jgi:F-type H+-transporting ATPase subunit a